MKYHSLSLHTSLLGRHIYYLFTNSYIVGASIFILGSNKYRIKHAKLSLKNVNTYLGLTLPFLFTNILLYNFAIYVTIRVIKVRNLNHW